MVFYDNNKDDRKLIVSEIEATIRKALLSGECERIEDIFSDEDTYIRKAGYLCAGRMATASGSLLDDVIRMLNQLLTHEDFRVRQTVINAAGEIGKKNFGVVETFFDHGLFDLHHSVRNAVIGSVKKMGEVNPKPVLAWAKKYLHHKDKEIRREICHGIELRGRKHPEDILPLLKELQFDKTARVRNTLVHVIGQISYKKGCLDKVLAHLATWENRELVLSAKEEIIDVHRRYAKFASLSVEEAETRMVNGN